MRRFFQIVGHCFKKTTGSSHLHALAIGMGAGAMLLALCFQWSARLGTSLAVKSALALAILVGIELGFRPLKTSRPLKTVAWLVLGCLVFLVTWTVSFPWLIEWQTELLSAFSPLQLSKPWLVLSLCFGFALVLITPAVIVASRLPFWLLSSERNAIPSRTLVPIFLLGTAAGMLTSAFVLAPILGLLPATIAVAVLACCSTGWQFVRRPNIDVVQVNEPAETTAAPAPMPQPTLWEYSREIWAALVLLILGGMLAWSSRFLDQLMPVSVSFVAARWSFIAIGFAVGFWWSSRRLLNPAHQSAMVSSSFLAAYGVMLAASFPYWVELCLSMTVAVQSVTLLTICRLGLVLVIMVPVGLVWGNLSALVCQARQGTGFDPTLSSHSKSIPTLASAVLSGWLFTTWVLLPYGSMVSIVIGLSLAAAILLGLRLLLAFTFPKRWFPRMAMAGLTLAFVASIFNVQNYRPQTSAELLFAAPVFVAHQSGLDFDLLTELDEGRLVATREGQQGTYTLWNYRGVQHQLRQNGLPKGMASGDTRLCPEYSAEALPAVMPLVLHERPDSVLILGLGSGVSLTTALAFPTQEVTCVETDPALIELVKEHIWSESLHAPTEDPRLTILPIDPALMLRSKSAAFDVIISLPHQVMVAETAACFTEAFYKDAARNLASDGLFCQRFTFVDFGPDALRMAARTMQAAFRDVVFLEMAGGEMLLMGTNSPQGIAREGFLARLQKQHVRRQLAALGWDWSVPLNLSAFNHEALAKFVAESPRRTPSNTLATGIAAFRLPGDMLRWGPKPQENQQALVGHLGRFAQWGGIDAEDPDLLRRLAEVTGQRRLMANHPDEYWAYRKSVKEQVTERPRSTIVQVKGELPRQEIHSEDQRRIDYFQVLGAAHKHNPHRPEHILAVESFAEPYDPLITFFLHQEVAELHSKSADRDHAAELGHRMHSVFFAAPQDRSVRNVIAALELLCEHPDSASTPLARWDHLNAMLQMLKQRWAVRAGVNPSSTHIALNDIDKSLAAVNRAIKTMDEFRAEAGIDEDEWQARRKFLEDTVVRPLRVYRRHLMPFHQRERVIQDKMDSLEEDETDAS